MSVSDTLEAASEKLSLPDESSSYKDLSPAEGIMHKTAQDNSKFSPLDMLAPPPTHNNTSKKSLLTSGETYASPHSDGLLSAGSGSGNSSIPAAGSALSVHHELQLLKEQLDQQTQQTQAAMAQLQLAREQLAAEQSARLEAQARTHQLLVHNRELLDHIAALVSHLQGTDKAANIPQSSPLMAMPQQQQQQQESSYHGEYTDSNSLEHSPVLQALGLNPQGLIENRAVTSCLPPSPLRTTFNPGGGVFNFNMPQNEYSFENQLLQRIQSLSGYTPPQYPCNYGQNLGYLSSLYGNPLMNNNYTLQPPPQKKFPSSPIPLRHSYTGSPVLDKRPSPARSNDAYQTQQQYQSQQNLQQQQQQQQQNLGFQQQQRQQSQQNLNQMPNQSNNLQVRSEMQLSRPDRKSEPRYIKPLSQMGTLTTTDSSGRVHVIVPVPSNTDDTANLLSSLHLGGDLKPNSVPTITRSTSEKVPNRSELMSQVQRTAWARHTTK
ncbi:PREDICTED: capon-like protein [Nicrophorus vespilloides]|uniref:Capon-like protein n=1 Tax=Nicrophorus vespilloides TaxID=110193 RepID=A0ABM1M3M2_NICVS|nr:PREDICTED: capon-like protein [Nicrophorus vespilloides]